jgi:hypothetical protein
MNGRSKIIIKFVSHLTRIISFKYIGIPIIEIYHANKGILEQNNSTVERSNHGNQTQDTAAG